MIAHSSDQSPIAKAKQEAQEVEEHVNRWRIVPLAKALYQRFGKDNTTGLASQVAYNLMFAIPPLLIFLLSLAALVDHVTGIPVAQDLQRAITQDAPADTKALLQTMVSYAVSQTSGKAASIGVVITVVLAFWGASGGVGTLIQSFNSAYEVKESRSFIPSTLMTLALTILLVVAIIVAFVLFVFGQKIGVLIANHFGLGSVFSLAWSIARWPAAIVIFMLLLALLYYWGPNVEQSFRWVSPGSVAATILWFLAVLGFKLYVTLSNPATGYGAAGSVLVLLFFLYLTGIIFILGAQINAVLGTRYDPETARDKAEHPEKRSSGFVPTSKPQPAGRLKPSPAEQPHASIRTERIEREHQRWLALGLGLGLIAGGLASRATGTLAKAKRRGTSHTKRQPVRSLRGRSHQRDVGPCGGRLM